MSNSSYKLFSDLAKSYNSGIISPPIIIADNLRTPENIGMILRLAGNMNSPLTIFIKNEDVNFKESKIKRTSSGASEKVKWIITSHKEFKNHIPDDYQIIALETCDDSKNIFNYSFPEKFAIMVGNEVLGISENVLQHANQCVYIPTPGVISSLNVTHALSVALFQWFNTLKSI